MLEVRRGLYCDERTGEASPSMRGVSRRLERAVAGAVSGWARRPQCGRPEQATRM